jgi:hypothetical protein
MLSNPFIMEVFPVPGAPVMTILFLPKHNNLTLQSNEIGPKKKNCTLSHIFVKK